jgi:very-short-patch-repair endonuclease
MRRPDLAAQVAALAATQHALVTFSQARSVGLSAKSIEVRLRSGAWERVYRRVYRMAGSPRTWDQALLAAVLAAGERAAISGEPAAAFWRVPGFPAGGVSVMLPVGMRTRQLPSELVHSCYLPEHHVVRVRGIPVTTPARTAFDLARLVHAGKAERALDNMLALRLTTIDAVNTVFEELAEHGRNGTALMRELLEERGEGYIAPESEMEHRFLRDVVERFGLPTPRRQVTTIAGRVDFLFDPGRLITELDGRRNHTAFLDREADAERDAKLAAQGLRVMRITWRRLTRRAAEVADDIRGALRAAA